MSMKIHNWTWDTETICVNLQDPEIKDLMNSKRYFPLVRQRLFPVKIKKDTLEKGELNKKNGIASSIPKVI